MAIIRNFGIILNPITYLIAVKTDYRPARETACFVSVLSALVLMLPTAIAAEERPRDFVRIAIVPFVELTGAERREGWGDAVAELIYSRLSSVKGIVAFRSAEMLIHLRELGKVGDDCTTKEVALLLGKRCSTDWIIYGTLGGKAKHVQADIMLLYIPTGREQKLLSHTTDEEGLLSLDQTILEQLLEAIKVKGQTSPDTQATDKIAAFGHYAKGIASINKGWEKDSCNMPEPFEEAHRWFARAIAADRNFVHASTMAGYTLLALAKHWNKEDCLPEAQAHFECALKLDPAEHFARSCLGWTLALKGNPDEGLTLCAKAASASPLEPMILANYGKAFAHKGEMNNAITWIRKAVDLNPADASLHCDLGVALFLSRSAATTASAKERAEKSAVESFRRAIELDPRNADAYAMLGLALGESDNPAAVQYLKTAVTLKPGDAQAYGTLGMVLAESDSEAAIVALQKAIALDPKNPAAYSGLVQLRLANHQYDQALKIAKKLIELGPENPFSHVLPSVIYFEKGDYTAARREIEQLDKRGYGQVVPAKMREYLNRIK